MSSTYRLLCLDHDPAIAVGHAEFTTPGAALAAVDQPTEQLAGDHRDCDLVVGRWSGDLVELACPSHDYHPRDAKWVDADWLRLLLAAGNTAHSKSSWLHVALDRLHNVRRCWTFDRLLRLRHQLGLNTPGGQP